MKLRTLAIASIVTAVVCVLAAGVTGTIIWRDASSRQAEVEMLVEMRDQAQRIDVAVRYLEDLRIEPEILRGLAEESRALRVSLESIGPDRQVQAIRHLEELESLARMALDGAARNGFDDAGSRGRLGSLILQMRIHESGAQEALNEVIDRRNRDIVFSLTAGLERVIFIAAVLLALALVSYWLVFRRVRKPIAEFSSAVRRFGRGESFVRLEIEGDDEFADVARLFNRAMAQRDEIQLQLNERIKEQRCLYQVLQLTTADDRPVAGICREIVELLPPHLLHAGSAAARLKLHGDEYTSRNWAEPRASMRAPIMQDGKAIGEIEIAYTAVHPEHAEGEGPFLREERMLLDSIAMHIARMMRDRAVTETLAQTQRMQAVGELTGGVAHDFNNLLTVIQGNAELLTESFRDRDPESAELAGMIDSAARRGAELTRSLLAFARRQALEPRVVRINSLLKEMGGLLRRTLGAHVDLKLKTHDDEWPVLIDPAQLETAVLNLVVNARDAMGEGGWLTIETANVQLDRAYADTRTDISPGDYVLIAVSDTGCGIEAGNLERVFEPFFTTKPKGRGTGLGLSMVYGFIKQSQGHVAVYSEPGEGTTVRMYVPRSMRAQIDEEPMHEPAAIEHGEAAILLVEDDDLVRCYVRDQLNALGYKVSVARNGPEALEALERDEPIDLLLTDIVMPGGMNGREVADAARSIRKNIGVLYMSGYTENAIIHHGRLDPGVKLLSKPFLRRELAQKVHEVLLQLQECKEGGER